MSAGRSALAMAAFGLAGLLVTGAVSGDSASSADSAWWPLPAVPASEPGDPLERRGHGVFQQRCAACHGEIPAEIFGPPFLPPMPGTQALRARYSGALPAELERRTDLTPEFVKAIVRNGQLSMPPFRPTEVSDEDLEALATYLGRDRSGDDQ
jgi:(+)-pinoresinol hydroxylase